MNMIKCPICETDISIEKKQFVDFVIANQTNINAYFVTKKLTFITWKKGEYGL